MNIAEKMKRLEGKVLVLLGMKEKKKKSPLPDLWRNDAAFQSLYKNIKGRTLVTPDRCFMLYQLAKAASKKQGAFAEVGVYRGGTARLVAESCPAKRFHLFDTFEGMPESEREVDYHQSGEFADTSLASVKKFLSHCSNVEFHEGLFPHTAQHCRDDKFCFVHVDVDIYPSMKAALEYFYPKMVPGGMMVFDDYQWKDCPGVEKAIHEFLADKDEVPIVTALYQCMIVKL